MSSSLLGLEPAKLSCSGEDDHVKKLFEREDDPKKKFLGNHDLVEMLLPFLDAPSTLNLAIAHPPTVRILQKGSNWLRFIRRSCLSHINYGNRTAEFNQSLWSIGSCILEEVFDERMEKIRPLIQILKLMKSLGDQGDQGDQSDQGDQGQGEEKNWLPYLLDLLDLISEISGIKDDDGILGTVKVTCPWHTDHKVGRLGFLILKELESFVGSEEQRWSFFQPTIWMSMRQCLVTMCPALRSRLVRQEGARPTISLGMAVCNNQNDAELLLDLVQRCEAVELDQVCVLGSLGAEGWASLAEATSKLAEFFYIIVVSGKNLLEAGKEDLRKIWHAVPVGGSFFVVEWDWDEVSEDSDGLNIAKGLVLVTHEGLGSERGEEYKDGNPEEQWKLLEQIMKDSD